MDVYMVSKDECPFCQKAKEFFTTHNVVYRERKINDYQERQAFYNSLGLTNGTVPQIFIDGSRIGGYSDLVKSDFLDKWNEYIISKSDMTDTDF